MSYYLFKQKILQKAKQKYDNAGGRDKPAETFYY